MKHPNDLLETGELGPVETIAYRVTGTRPSRTTTWRWVKRGVGGGIRLQAVLYLDRWMTTEAAFREFLHRRTEAALQPQTVPPASDDDLRAAGLL